MEFYPHMDWNWTKTLRNAKCFPSKIQIPQLDILGPKVGPNYFISNIAINVPYILTTPDTSLLPNIHTKYLSHSFPRLIPPPEILFSLFYLHFCHQSNHTHFQSTSQMIRPLGPFPKQQANVNVFSPTLLSPRVCLYVHYITFHTLSSVHSIVCLLPS